MSYKSYIFICTLFFSLIAVKSESQTNKNVERDISLNLSSYTFSYKAIPENADFSLGPVCTLNSNGKISFDFGFLIGIRKYKIYNGIINDEVHNVFLPFTISYHFIRNKIFGSFITGGFIFGGNYGLTKENRVYTIGSSNIILGIGVNYQILKRVIISAYPSLRYNSRAFLPGIHLSLGLLLNSDKLKP